MSLQRNYYEVIGVAPTATTDDIKKKYRELARQFHPDVVKDKTLGQKVFTQINQAYRVLADPEKRSQYDTTLVADQGRAMSAANGIKPPSAPAAPASQNGAAASAAAQPITAQQSANAARLMGEAETAMMQNKLGSVKTICDKVLEIDPRNGKALSLMGDALVQMGKPRDAIAAYKRAQQIAPSALLQNKISRLEGTLVGTAPSPTPPPPAAHRTGGVPGKPTNTTSQNRTEQGREEKPASGLLGRLLGRK